MTSKTESYYIITHLKTIRHWEQNMILLQSRNRAGKCCRHLKMNSLSVFCRSSCGFTDTPKLNGTRVTLQCEEGYRSKCDQSSRTCCFRTDYKSCLFTLLYCNSLCCGYLISKWISVWKYGMSNIYSDLQLTCSIY